MRRTQLGSSAILAVTSLALFGLLADAAVERDGITAVDRPIAADVVHARSPIATTVAHVFTFLGSEIAVGALALGLMILLVERGRLVQAASTAVAMAGSAAMTLGVKDVIGRTRPPTVDRLGPVDQSYSFPSGHTLNSAVLIGLAMMFLLPLIESRSARIGLGAIAVTVAAGIGASRVYLGYHWSTDVSSSWFLAAAWLVAISCLTRLLTAHTPRFLRSGGGQVDRPSVAS